jgi:tellurite methyltransferase
VNPVGKLDGRALRDRPWYELEPYGGFWERGYSDLNVSTLGGPSAEVIELTDALPAAAKVLDLGCGEGRNALYLASQGFDVTAVDRSESGIRKLQYVAEKAGVSVSAHVADVATIDLEDEYDVVMAHGLLHYLSQDECADLLSEIREHTVAGGFNVYTYKYFNEEFPRPDEFRSARQINALDPWQLRDIYDGWECLRYDVYAKWDSHPGIPIHLHPCEKLVARKPAEDTDVKAEVDPLPVQQESLDDQVFDEIDIRMGADEVERLCGAPSHVELICAQGVQFGGFEAIAWTDYRTDQLYFGWDMVELYRGQVRSKNRYKTQPVRVRYIRSPKP